MMTAFTWGGLLAALFSLLLAVARQDPLAIGMAVLSIVNLFINPPTPTNLGLRKAA